MGIAQPSQRNHDTGFLLDQGCLSCLDSLNLEQVEIFPDLTRVEDHSEAGGIHDGRLCPCCGSVDIRFKQHTITIKQRFCFVMYAITAHINLMNSMITCGIESHESEAREHPEVVVRGRGRWGGIRSSWEGCSTLATRIATGQP